MYELQMCQTIASPTSWHIEYLIMHFVALSGAYIFQLYNIPTATLSDGV